MTHLILQRFFATCCPRCKSIDFRNVGAQNAVETAFRWIVQPRRCCLCGRHLYLIRPLAAWRNSVKALEVDWRRHHAKGENL